MSLRPLPEWLATCEAGDAAVILLEDIQKSSPGRERTSVREKIRVQVDRLSPLNTRKRMPASLLDRLGTTP